MVSFWEPSVALTSRRWRVLRGPQQLGAMTGTQGDSEERTTDLEPAPPVCSLELQPFVSTTTTRAMHALQARPTEGFQLLEQCAKRTSPLPPLLQRMGQGNLLRGVRSTYRLLVRAITLIYSVMPAL